MLKRALVGPGDSFSTEEGSSAAYSGAVALEAIAVEHTNAAGGAIQMQSIYASAEADDALAADGVASKSPRSPFGQVNGQVRTTS